MVPVKDGAKIFSPGWVLLVVDGSGDEGEDEQEGDRPPAVEARRAWRAAAWAFLRVEARRRGRVVWLLLIAEGCNSRP